MTTTHAYGRQKELGARRVKNNTIVTPDNQGILLEKETLLSISNKISSITGAKMTATSVSELVDMIKYMPPEQFFKRSLNHAENTIAKMFMTKHLREAAHVDVGLDRDGGDNTHLGDYMKQEVMQTSADEHQYKYTAHADRRGNSIIDRDRVDGLRSSPNNVASSYGINPELGVNDPAFIGKIMEALNRVGSSFDPENIDQMFDRARSSVPGLQTFQNICFPHRVVPLDSRNKLQAHNMENEIKWNLHSSGDSGRLGDVRIQDTLQEVIRVKICPFWIPIQDPLDEYYDKIRIHIKEFWQASIVTEFLESDQTTPTTYNYHFEMEITEKKADRILLTPICNTYTFSKPIARIETLTVCFRSPFKAITLLDDQGLFTMTYSIAAAAPTVFSINSGVHNLNTGDLVYIIDTNTGNNALTSTINRTSGHFITRINNTDFSINVDTNTLSPGSETNISVVYGSKRIFLQMEFTSLEH